MNQRLEDMGASVEGAFTYFNFSVLPFFFHMSIVIQALFKQYFLETSLFVMYFSSFVYTSRPLLKLLCIQACLFMLGQICILYLLPNVLTEL